MPTRESSAAWPATEHVLEVLEEVKCTSISRAFWWASLTLIARGCGFRLSVPSTRTTTKARSVRDGELRGLHCTETVSRSAVTVADVEATVETAESVPCQIDSRTRAMMRCVIPVSMSRISLLHRALRRMREDRLNTILRTSRFRHADGTISGELSSHTTKAQSATIASL